MDPHWSGDGNRFWYRNDLADGVREFVVVDAAKGTKQPAFDHAKLAEALSKTLGKPVDATRLPITAIDLEDGGKIRLATSDDGFRFNPSDGSLEKAEAPKADEPAAEPRRPGQRNRFSGSARRETSPDGKYSTFVKNHNLYLRVQETGEEIAIGEDGAEKDFYEPRVFWSPDSKKLVALKTTPGDDRKVNLIESSPRNQLQPRTSSYDYLKPGDRVPISKPKLFDVDSRKQIEVKDDLFANPFSMGEYRWSADSSRFTFLFNQRGHQAVRVVAIDAKSGEAKAVVDETSKTFVDYSTKGWHEYLDGTNEILWMSERDGWNHLYLIDAIAGTVKNQVTRGEWLVRGVDRVDPEKRQVWFHAGGIRPGQDPYYIHFARVNFDGTGLVVLTEGDGSHAVRYSPDRRFLIDTYSRVDMPPVAELRRVEDGSLVCGLEHGDMSALVATGWKVPERFAAKGRDGKTDIFGVIYRPTNFDPSKKYPVIEAIYAGPQGAFVPKNFAPVQGAQPLAELGFIVVQIDGMGTNFRSKAFHDVCWKNLGDAGFPDRIAWMKAAAEKDPAMDLTRVGIYGGSAGGQNAMGGLLFHPEFYKVGVADCGCHDNRMDKIWWNEAWMGWPVGREYEDSSNVVNAHKLRGKLLLTVGELDHNVDPSSTMQVVAALIKANKDFDFVVFPGADHGAGSSPYGERRRRDFFVRHLLNVEPRSH